MTCEDFKAMAGDDLTSKTVAENSAWANHVKTCTPCYDWFLVQAEEEIANLSPVQLLSAVVNAVQYKIKFSQDPEA